MIESLQHFRMKAAFSFMEEMEEADLILGNKKKDYRGRVQSLSVLIHDSGLMQTLAFFLSKTNESDHHIQLLANQLLRWINRPQFSSSPSTIDNDTLSNLDKLKRENLKSYKTLMDKSSMELLRLTNDLLAMVEWLSRFADAKFKEKGEE